MPSTGAKWEVKDLAGTHIWRSSACTVSFVWPMRVRNPVQKNKRQKHGCGPMNLPAWLLTSCYVWYFLTNNIILYIIYSFTRRRAGSNTSKKWLPASHDFRYCCKNQALSGTLRHGRDFNFDRAQLGDLLECMNSKLHSPWFLRDLSYNAEISICVALRSRIYWI